MMMDSPTGRGRRRKAGPPSAPRAIIAVLVLAILLLIAAVAGYSYLHEHPKNPAGSGTTMPMSAPTTAQTLQVALALKKPAELDGNDEVVYRDHVCWWLRFEHVQSISRIQCGGQQQITVATAHIVPAVLRTDGGKRD